MNNVRIVQISFLLLVATNAWCDKKHILSSISSHIATKLFSKPVWGCDITESCTEIFQEHLAP